MDKYLKNNQALWDERTSIHEQSEFYDVESIKKGKCTLKSIELEEMGDVSGKALLHLQCHFGLDTLSWARRGAKATGVDFSDKAIDLARSLSKETGIKVDFICSDIYQLPEILHKKYDIIFTSYGALCWLPDLKKWAELIAHFLKRGGYFYIVEFHPVMLLLDDAKDAIKFGIRYPYFPTGKPLKFEPSPDYADRTKSPRHGSYEWPYPMSDIITSLANAGLRIEFLHEFPVCTGQNLPLMKQDKDGWWRLDGDLIPLMFSLKAIKF
jgi:SAM-dependent methyltransferase